MPLYLKDPRIDEMVAKIRAKTHQSKTAIVRAALEGVVANENIDTKLFAAIRKIQEDLKKSQGPNAGHKMTKEEIDWLYE